MELEHNTENTITFLSECFPHIDKERIRRLVKNYPNDSIDALCDRLLSNRIDRNVQETIVISDDPVSWDQQQEEEDYLLAKKLQEEEDMLFAKQIQDGKGINVNNSLLTQLHHERISRQSTSVPHGTSKIESLNRNSGNQFLANIHERRLKQNISSNPGSKIQKTSKIGQKLSTQEQLRLARQKHRQKWRESTPTARTMTLKDLEEREKFKQQSIAGNWSTQSNRRQIHTIQNTFYDPDRIGREALEYTNQFRKKNGLPPLMWSQKLAEIGKVHSKNMGDGKVPFGHAGFDERVRKFPFPTISAAENVAMNSGVSDIAKVAVDGWIKSPGHRKNLLAKHNYCGIGVAQNSKGAWYLTQLFALTK